MEDVRTGTGAVTVAIVRRVDPEDLTRMQAWVSAGTSMAERFPGFLGFGWVRPDGRSDEWHMLYRFADQPSLERWESSPERAWWLRSAEGMVRDARSERRVGIEGWFDPPVETSVVAADTPAPPRWRQAVTIWLAFFPLNLLATWLLAPVVTGWPLVLRVLLTTVLLTPVMTYVGLPLMTRVMRPFLQAR